MTLTLLMMAGPGKLMVGHMPSRPASGYATVTKKYGIIQYHEVSQ